MLEYKLNNSIFAVDIAVWLKKSIISNRFRFISIKLLSALGLFVLVINSLYEYKQNLELCSSDNIKELKTNKTYIFIYDIALT